MKYLIPLLILISSVSLAKDIICDENCKSVVESCQPITKDFESKNRFFSCGGKPAKLTNEVLKEMTPSCRAEFKVLLDYVVKLEKRGNFCAQKSDCIMSEAGLIPVHLNEKLFPIEQYKINLELEKVIIACPNYGANSFEHWVQPKDRARPNHYECVQSVCVPQYDGYKENWYNIRGKIRDKRDPNLELFMPFLEKSRRYD